jgi:hypothetical protein
MLMAPPMTLFRDGTCCRFGATFCSRQLGRLSLRKTQTTFFLRFLGLILAYARGFYFLGTVPKVLGVLFSCIILAVVPWNSRLLFSVIGLLIILRLAAIGWGIGVGT